MSVELGIWCRFTRDTNMISFSALESWKSWDSGNTWSCIYLPFRDRQHLSIIMRNKRESSIVGKGSGLWTTWKKAPHSSTVWPPSKKLIQLYIHAFLYQKQSTNWTFVAYFVDCNSTWEWRQNVGKGIVWPRKFFEGWHLLYQSLENILTTPVIECST